MKLSITLIGHNEAVHLVQLLPELQQWADEVIYVDCDSSDASLEIARQYQCLTFERPNHANLNVNKSYAIEQATSEWIFYLDPDERISPDLREEIKQLIRSKPRQNAFQLSRQNHYFGKWLRYGSQYPDWQLRLFRRGKAVFPNQHVHEKLRVEGEIGQLKHDMQHHPYLNISQFLKKFDFYTSVEASYLVEKGVTVNFWNSLRFLLQKPFSRFIRRFLFKQGFRDGFPGLFCALFDALNQMVRYFKLWEQTHTPP